MGKEMVKRQEKGGKWEGGGGENNYLSSTFKFRKILRRAASLSASIARNTSIALPPAARLKFEGLPGRFPTQKGKSIKEKRKKKGKYIKI